MLLLALVPSVALAQPKPDGRGQLEVVTENGVKALKITAGGKVALTDLVRLYAECKDAAVIGDTQLRGDFEILAGLASKTFAGEGLDLFVQDALETSRVGFRVGDNGILLISVLVEMGSRVSSISEDELAKANPAHWANLVFSPRHCDISMLRAGLQNLTSRQGGQVNTVIPTAVIITERVDRLRQLLKTAKEIDAAAAQTLKTYALPEGVEATAAEKALRDLFTDAKDMRGTRVTVIAATRKILVLAKADVHTQVVESIKQLK